MITDGGDRLKHHLLTTNTVKQLFHFAQELLKNKRGAQIYFQSIIHTYILQMCGNHLALIFQILNVQNNDSLRTHIF